MSVHGTLRTLTVSRRMSAKWRLPATSRSNDSFVFERCLQAEVSQRADLIYVWPRTAPASAFFASQFAARIVHKIIDFSIGYQVR
jgi:hypothetical protein